MSNRQSKTAQRAVDLAMQGAQGAINMEEENKELAAAGFAEQQVEAPPGPDEGSDFLEQLKKEQPSAKEESKEDEEKAEDEAVKFSDDPAKRLDEMHAFFTEQFPPQSVPPKEHLAKWKNWHGSVFFVPIGDVLYIYRFLKRQEWMQMNADENWQKMKEGQRKEHIYNKCVLWPSLTGIQLAGQPAGIQDTLVSQIEAQSGWLNAYELASVTFKL